MVEDLEWNNANYRWPTEIEVKLVKGVLDQQGNKIAGNVIALRIDDVQFFLGHPEHAHTFLSRALQLTLRDFSD